MTIAVDLGTATTVAWSQERGLMAEEASLLAVDTQTGRVLAIGKAARQMAGRTGPEIRLVAPIQGGKLADPEMAVELVKQMVGQALGWRRLLHPHLVLGLGESPQSFASHTFLELLRKAGWRKVELVPRALAAARGAGLNVEEPEGHALVDLGAGGTEITIVTMGQVIAARAVAVGGQALDEAIQRYLAAHRGLEISREAAEEIKIQLPDEAPVVVQGRDQASGLPARVEVEAEAIREALREPLSRIAGGVQQALEQVPPALAADLVDRGLVLTGGGARLRGLDRHLQSMTGLPVRIAERPEHCVAAGLGAVRRTAAAA